MPLKRLQIRNRRPLKSTPRRRLSKHRIPKDKAQVILTIHHFLKTRGKIKWGEALIFSDWGIFLYFSLPDPLKLDITGYKLKISTGPEPDPNKISNIPFSIQDFETNEIVWRGKTDARGFIDQVGTDLGWNPSHPFLLKVGD